MHADHRQTEAVTERGRQETQIYADRCMLTIKTDAITERGTQETQREKQTDAC